MLLDKNLTMRFNFLKLLDRILLKAVYVITSFLMTSRLRHYCVVMW